ncbi:ABC transporter ATP-binding protein [Alkalimonas sp.]|uniref:ABC transporter ATP-binding protein n=1 Tax=Alkalimonas sp. TaxID=1872453 RepID=UPI00263BCA90|nr:ABC transporter ATP-binding protein [Alkalimonas sp.]MCC5825682.1 ABC transporter ATP-binding protein [Alkalimonas sp.]
MTTVIACSGLSKSFGQKAVLKQLDFKIETGAPVALVGANGAGKTTLLSLLCGYLTPDQGQIQILGQKPGSVKLKGRLGALPQDAQFDPDFSLARQLQWLARLQGMTASKANTETERVLALVDLTAEAGLKVAQLSHGMRKRLAIAQALLGEPELVVLDEPTAGLDPLHAKALRDCIQQHSTHCTFVISSHNLFELEQLCGTVLMLEQGRIRQQATQISETGVLRLQLCQENGQQLLPLLQQVPGFVKSQLLSKLQLELQYDAVRAADFDVRLLQLLHQQSIDYRQLSRGPSLEQQLFQSGG